VIVPEHIFIIFNTGVHRRNKDVISYDKTSYIVRDSYIWLPVETTELGGSFLSAWLKGIEEYKRWAESGQMKIIDVKEGWEKYPPVALPPENIPLKVSDKDQILAKLEKEILEINNYRGDTFSLLVSKYKEEIKKRPNNVQVRNNLGIVYGKREYDLAIKEFEEILRMDKYNSSVLNNIGNIYLLKGRVEEANEYYRKAKGLDPDDGGIKFNIGLASFLMEDEKGALGMLQEALESFPTIKEASNVLGFELIEAGVYLKGKAGKISKEEVKQLLEKALKKVPLNKEEKEEVKKTLTFFAGTRGADLSQATELSWLLYWKE
jgi:tetratricopeptide (TPR) repeat protein